jgi:hypothetical protein
MDETEWLGCVDPAGMLDYLGNQASDRKVRLFACACVRLKWRQLIYAAPRDAVDLAERFAEGQATLEEVEQMRQQADMAAMNAPEFDRYIYLASAVTLAESAAEAARTAREFMQSQAVYEALLDIAPMENETQVAARARQEVSRAQGRLLHELFGNPFRPVRIEPAWLAWCDGAVAGMARLIDEEGRFDELPYLADALTDAGCDNDELIRHLREPVSRHLRGCWALEALVGRQ